MAAAPHLGLFCTILVISVATNTTPPVAAKEEFRVGDAEGWRNPGVNDTELYNHWAEKRRFHIGDSLRFEYKNDSVMVVDKYGYYHCNATSPISVFKDGNTVVNLDKPGPMYFASGDSEHCKDGQRLEVEVLPLHPVSRSPPAPARTPPTPYLAASPSPSPLSSSGVSVSVEVMSVFVALIATLMD